MTLTSARIDGYWGSGQARPAAPPTFDVTYSANAASLTIFLDQGSSDFEIQDHQLAEPTTDRVAFVADLPESLVAAYAEAASRHAIVRELEDGSFFASILALPGVWGAGTTETYAFEDLAASIPGWVEVHREQGLPIPDIEGFDLNL